VQSRAIIVVVIW